MTLSRISAAHIRAAWLDTENHRTIAAAGRSVGLSRMQFYVRAKELGLGARPHGHGKLRPSQVALFKAMWTDGVSLAEIGRVFGVDPMTVSSWPPKYDLPRRQKGPHQISMKVSEWREAHLARAMAASARIEQAAMINAGMSDKRRDNRMVGSEHARAAL